MTTPHHTPWVLTLGDGSLSFSYSFTKKFLPAQVRGFKHSTNELDAAGVVDSQTLLSSKRSTTSQGACFLVATTFDSTSELILKFREAGGIRNSLLNMGVPVLGCVDATNIVRTLNASAHAHINDSLPTPETTFRAAHDDGGNNNADDARSNTFSDPQNQKSEALIQPFPSSFDIIVFNNPHTGVENFLRHQILLRHFFHSALAVLAPKGQVWVALCDEQPVRWRLLEIARSQGLICVLRTEFNEEMWPSYTHKRHQNDQSFPAGYMEHFIFVRKTDYDDIFHADAKTSQLDEQQRYTPSKIQRTEQSNGGCSLPRSVVDSSFNLHEYCTASIDDCFVEVPSLTGDSPIRLPLLDLAKMKSMAKKSLVSVEKAPTSSVLIPSKIPKITTNTAKTFLAKSAVVESLTVTAETDSTAAPVLLNHNGNPLTSRELLKLNRLRARLEKDEQQRAEKDRKKRELEDLLEKEPTDGTSTLLRCPKCVEASQQHDKDIENKGETRDDNNKTEEEIRRKHWMRIYPTQSDLDKHIQAKHKQPVLHVTSKASHDSRHDNSATANSEKDEKNVEEKHYCFVCNMRFVNNDEYRLHFMDLQPSSARFECLTCARVFSNQRALEQHILFSQH